MAEKVLKIGTILCGKAHTYRIVDVLGSGSFGITYLADVILSPQSGANTSVRVTIKEFFMKELNGREGSSVTSGSNDGYFVKYLGKFIKEAEKLSNVASRGVVKVLECFETNNTAYYSMQYLSGGSLNDLISRHGKIPVSIALYFTLQIAYALKDLHDLKMLHLDLKPSNVMLTSTFETVLIDFGLSKQYNPDGEPESSTTIGAGTRGYAPIEQSQYQDGHDFPATMDIYALGGTLYKMLCGVVPPEASYILNEGFPEERLINAGVSPLVVDFVKEMMSPMKKARPQSIGQVISGIKSIGTRISMASKSEVDQWVSRHEDLSQGDEDSEIEIVAVSGGKDERDYTRSRFNDLSSLDKVEIKVVQDSNKPHTYQWFSVTASAKYMEVVYHKKGEQFAHKKRYLYSQEKFKELLAKMRTFTLTSGPFDSTSGMRNGGLWVKAFHNGAIVFDASSCDEGGNAGLEGQLDKLTNLVWKESGLISFDSLTSADNGRLSRIINFLRTPSRWLGYLAIFSIVVFTYVLCNPIDTYIKNNYQNDIVYSWSNPETKRFHLEAVQGGKGGVYYSPAHKWVVPPHYMRSNPDDFSVSEFTLDSVSILSQQDDFALIVKDGQTIFYRGDNTLIKLPYSDYGKVEKVAKNLYEVMYREEPMDFVYAIYNSSGDPVLPFSNGSLNIIADNVIKRYDYDGDKYYDFNGKLIQTSNFIVLYDKYGWMVNVLAVAVLSLLLCFLANLGYKRYKKAKAKTPDK